MADVAIRLQPRAKREEVVGERAGAIVIRVTAPPVDGKANAALCAFIAKAVACQRRVSTWSAGRPRATRWYASTASQPKRCGLRYSVNVRARTLRGNALCSACRGVSFRTRPRRKRRLRLCAGSR